MKVLIVDDSKAMRMIVTRTLKQAGFSGLETLEAGDGTEALEVVAKEDVDLILSDWNMPQMKGIEFLQALREKGDKTPLGFITSESGEDVAQRAKEAGAQFVITKPFTADRFEAVLGPILV